MSRLDSGAATAIPAPKRLVGVPDVLRQRDFRRFWLGETVSLVGDQLTLIALPLVAVLELDASAS